MPCGRAQAIWRLACAGSLRATIWKNGNVDEALMPEAGLDAADMCSLAMISGRARMSLIAAMRSSSGRSGARPFALMASVFMHAA